MILFPPPPPPSPASPSASLEFTPNDSGYVLKIGANVPRIADHIPFCFTKISARFHILFAFTNVPDTGTNPDPV